MWSLAHSNIFMGTKNLTFGALDRDQNLLQFFIGIELWLLYEKEIYPTIKCRNI